MKKDKIVGNLISLLIFIFIVLTISSLFVTSGKFDFNGLLNDNYIKYVTYFSFMQASISTALSVLFSIFLSLSLYRRNFLGKTWFLRLISLSFVLPTLVAVFGIVAIYGNSGLISQILNTKSFNIYGLSGIILAHLFFNIPLGVKIFYQSLLTIDTKQHRLAHHLGLRAIEKFLHIEFYAIKQQLPYVSLLIFMLCFTSFAIVMALGGGVKSTTIEVAIYQAIAYDFDLSLGAILAIWQILICGFLSFAVQKFAKPANQNIRSDKNQNYFVDSKLLKLFDFILIILFIMFVLPPLIAVFYAGINESFLKSIKDFELYKALWNSLTIAFCSSFLAMIFSIFIILSIRAYKIEKKYKIANILEFSANIILIVPSLVISTGLFILLYSFVDVFSYAFYVIVLVNSLMAIPFVMRMLSSSFLSLALQYNKLSISIGLKGFYKLKFIEFKALKDTIKGAIGLAFVLSFGDLSAIALFGSPDFKTLPLLLYEQMGSYRMNEAALSASLLLLVSILVFAFSQRSFSVKG